MIAGLRPTADTTPAPPRTFADPLREAGIIASLLQPVGNLVVTMAAKVPLNNRLARVIPDSAEGVVVWADYLKRWTLWNHVRALSALAAVAWLICLLP
ncbi:anthrone oxygenase family protein [Ferrovibrio xuzhouensis]|uniref:Anthrone oxygenase family protein n=1 Tax=Ferrovibrio xuzhouensis TaxID=1576914 RepID=A0ABV7VLB1_9PROT